MHKNSYIPINEHYLYSPEHNLVINAETRALFDKFRSLYEPIRIIPVEPSVEFLQKSTRKIKQLIIEVTQDCNLRCHYCLFGDAYPHHRERTSNFALLDIILKGIDYVHSHLQSRDQKKFSLGFYGGEPLLRFDTVVNSVRHARKTFQDWELEFSITTNGTLLDEDKIDFLIENQFGMVVSLDGPALIHNQKRVYQNGGGSFQAVFDNLGKIRKRNKAYYEHNVGLSIVWSRELPLRDVYQFFTKHPQVKKNILYFTSPIVQENTYYETHPYDEAANLAEIKRILQGIIRKIKNKQPLAPMDRVMLMNEVWNSLKKKDFNSLYGCCAFDDKLYLDVFGRFHICNSMNNKFPLGDVWKGFDYPRMQEILKNYMTFLETQCADCGYRFLCARCFPLFAGDGGFQFNTQTCRNIQKTLQGSLLRHVKLSEMGISEQVLKNDR